MYLVISMCQDRRLGIVTVIPISDTSHTNHCHDHWYISIFQIIKTKNRIGIILGNYAGIEGLYKAAEYI